MAGITAPATLSVILGFSNKTVTIPQLSLDWNSLGFVNLHVKDSGLFQEDNALPSSEVLRIATLSAESMAVIPPLPPAPNSSFNLQFFGPTVQCSIANSSQQPIFDYYSNALANNTVPTFTKSLFESGKVEWANLYKHNFVAMNVYLAFSL